MVVSGERPGGHRLEDVRAVVPILIDHLRQLAALCGIDGAVPDQQAEGFVQSPRKPVVRRLRIGAVDAIDEPDFPAPGRHRGPAVLHHIEPAYFEDHVVRDGQGDQLVIIALFAGRMIERIAILLGRRAATGEE